MIPLDDPKWRELAGGYGVPYDASIPLHRLEMEENVWAELWEELHHQGDVGIASYAAVPHLVRIVGSRPERDWNFYGLISTIEIERHRKSNPILPGWLTRSYQEAWQTLLDLALHDLKDARDQTVLRCILGTVALARSDLKLGTLIVCSDDAEIAEILERSHAWSDLYE